MQIPLRLIFKNEVTNDLIHFKGTRNIIDATAQTTLQVYVISPILKTYGTLPGMMASIKSPPERYIFD